MKTLLCRVPFKAAVPYEGPRVYSNWPCGCVAIAVSQWTQTRDLGQIFCASHICAEELKTRALGICSACQDKTKSTRHQKNRVTNFENGLVIFAINEIDSIFVAETLEKRCLIPVRVTQNRGASSVRQLKRLTCAAATKVRIKRLDLRFLEIGALRVVFTKRDPEFPGISGQVV
eukprot:sb/3472045/